MKAYVLIKIRAGDVKEVVLERSEMSTAKRAAFGKQSPISAR